MRNWKEESLMTITLTDEKIQFFNLIQKPLTKQIEQGFQELLNNKHLYQSLRIDFFDGETIFDLVQDDLNELLVSAPKLIRPVFDQLFPLVANARWSIFTSRGRLASYLGGGSNLKYEGSISFTPKTIRNYCRHCESIEPYNFINGGDIISDINSEISDIQIFVLSYECQGCKNIPEVFLVRREGMKIILSGRSPMEQVIVPRFIPKKQSEYISNAIVAFDSGQILSGIFQLRTFLEQYVRSKSSDSNTEDIESLFKEYSLTLPEDFKKRFPSLREIYNTLSDCIHLADSNEDVFKKSRDDIYKHFDAKRVHEINN
jgi:hypothetical protein